MASAITLAFNILAEDKGSQVISNFATKVGTTFDKLGAKIGGDLGEIATSVGNAFEDIGRAAPRLGVQLTAIGGAALGVGTALKIMATNDDQAQAQLKAAIEATGASWDDYEAQIHNAIKAGENFAYTADKTENALQVLTAATNSPTLALQYLSLAEDIAASRHTSLENAATQVARAIGGSLRIFKTYGITLDGVGTKAEQITRALEELQKKVSGQAQASVAGFGGALEVLRAKATDLVTELAGPVGSALQGFGAATALLGSVIESGIVQKFAKSISSAEGFGAKLATIAKTAFNPWTLAITAATVGITLFLQSNAEAEQRVQGLTAAIQADNGALSENTRQTVINDLAKTNAFKDAKTLGLSLNTVTDALLGNADAQNLVNAAIAEHPQTTRSTSGEVGAAQDLSRALGDESGAIKDARQAYDDQTAAMGDVTAATDTQTAAIDKQVSAYDALTSALLSFNNVQIDLQRGQIGVANAVDGLDKALKTSKGTLNLHTQAGRDARGAALDFAKAVDDEASAMANAKKPHEDIVKYIDAERNTLQKTLEKFGMGPAAAKKYADALLKIPKTVRTAVTAEVTLQVTLAGLAKNVALGTAGRLTRADFLTPAAGGYVTGMGGGTADNIPAMLSSGEYVLNTKAVQRMGVNELHRINAGSSGGGGAGITVVVNHNGPGELIPQAVVRAIQTYERRNGSGWRR